MYMYFEAFIILVAFFFVPKNACLPSPIFYLVFIDILLNPILSYPFQLLHNSAVISCRHKLKFQ